MKKSFNRGFTLIELLVVVAIIGILSGIVLTSLGSARDKARDAAIQGNLSGLRAAAEVYYTDKSSYDSMFTGNNTCASVDDSVSKSLESIDTEKACFSSANDYAASAQLVSDSNGYWCVDSAGTSKKITTQVTGTSCE